MYTCHVQVVTHVEYVNMCVILRTTHLIDLAWSLYYLQKKKYTLCSVCV